MEAGSVEKAAEALWGAKMRRAGPHLCPEKLRGISDLHRQYLAEVAALGVPVQAQGPEEEAQGEEPRLYQGA